jgi:hypothetical protein
MRTLVTMLFLTLSLNSWAATEEFYPQRSWMVETLRYLGQGLGGVKTPLLDLVEESWSDSVAKENFDFWGYYGCQPAKFSAKQEKTSNKLTHKVALKGCSSFQSEAGFVSFSYDQHMKKWSITFDRAGMATSRWLGEQSDLSIHPSCDYFEKDGYIQNVICKDLPFESAGQFETKVLKRVDLNLAESKITGELVTYKGLELTKTQVIETTDGQVTVKLKESAVAPVRSAEKLNPASDSEEIEDNPNEEQEDLA